MPQILIDGVPIGGYTELWRLDKSGALDEPARRLAEFERNLHNRAG